jgi:hypothetical protein
MLGGVLGTLVRWILQQKQLEESPEIGFLGGAIS